MQSTKKEKQRVGFRLQFVLFASVFFISRSKNKMPSYGGKHEKLSTTVPTSHMRTRPLVRAQYSATFTRYVNWIEEKKMKEKRLKKRMQSGAWRERDARWCSPVALIFIRCTHSNGPMCLAGKWHITFLKYIEMIAARARDRYSWNDFAKPNVHVQR